MANTGKSYRFTFGPWNISTGADPFGPPVRAEVAFAAKLREYKKLGFDGVQFHDDDIVPADLDWEGLLREGDTVLVEWPERAGAWLPSPTQRFRLYHVADPDRRGLESL